MESESKRLAKHQVLHGQRLARARGRCVTWIRKPKYNVLQSNPACWVQGLTLSQTPGVPTLHQGSRFTLRDLNCLNVGVASCNPPKLYLKATRVAHRCDPFCGRTCDAAKDYHVSLKYIVPFFGTIRMCLLIAHEPVGRCER